MAIDKGNLDSMYKLGKYYEKILFNRGDFISMVI